MDPTGSTERQCSSAKIRCYAWVDLSSNDLYVQNTVADLVTTVIWMTPIVTSSPLSNIIHPGSLLASRHVTAGIIYLSGSR